MTPTFEELADAGVESHLRELNATKSQSRKWQISLIALLGLSAALFVYWKQQATRDYTPIAAKILLSADETTTNILPHREDDSTEFKSSFEFLKEEATVPKFRETEEASMVKAPAYISKTQPTIQLDAPKAVEIKTASLLSVNTPAIQATSSPSVALAQTPDSAIIDWSGMVLVPDDHILAKAYNSDVNLLRIEAHPIDDGHIRVWARIQNRTNKTLQTEVACEFRGATDFERPRFVEVTLDPRGVVDTYFVSQNPKVHAYTVMVKR